MKGSSNPIARFFAHLFSIVFHPLLMPTYAVILFAAGDRYIFPPGARYELVGLGLTTAQFKVLQVFLLTAFYPAFAIFLLIRLDFASGVNLPGRSERVIPYVMSGAMFIWAYTVFSKSGDHEAIQGILLGASIAIFAALLVNQLFFKISAHTTGVGGMIASIIYFVPFMYYDISWILLVGALIAGLVGSSRLLLKAHETREVYAGYLNGFFCQSVAFQLVGIL